MSKTATLARPVRYGIAVASVVVACEANAVIPELEGAGAVLFLAAVTVSAYYGGKGPGLLATGLSILVLDYFFVSEIRAVDFGPAVYVSLAVFLVVALAANALHAAQRRLQATLRLRNRRQGEFMAVLAHELRNFLSPMAPAAAVLKARAKGDDSTTRSCEIIERQLQNITRLVGDLLDAARVNEGKVSLALAPLDLRDVVRQAADAARPLIEARRHRLELSLPAAPLCLEGDPTRLQQVFVNLLTNAAKYTQPGGRISLAVERSGTDLVARVQDNGQGLSPQVLPHLFDLFTQAQVGSQGGLGIGLSLVRGLVELHGGSVTAASEGPGRGSQFVVRLPGARTSR
jgi:signal transduction histidine kinase